VKQPAAKARQAKPAKSPAVAKQRRVAAPVAKTSKAQTVVAALKRPNGATLADLIAATGWQAHSVRGFLSGTVRKRLGLALTVEQRDGERRYHVAA
jgi:hypothetical protein